MPERDNGRGLRSYAAALEAIAACAAFARADYTQAALLARGTASTFYYGRSIATLLTLEADARAALGQTAAADSIRDMIASRSLRDTDPEIVAYFARLAADARSPD